MHEICAFRRVDCQSWPILAKVFISNFTSFSELHALWCYQIVTASVDLLLAYAIFVEGETCPHIFY